VSTVQIIFLAMGGYLLWFGVTHFGDGTSPAAPLKSLVSGKGLT
jgi:hypothetical protein